MAPPDAVISNVVLPPGPSGYEDVEHFGVVLPLGDHWCQVAVLGDLLQFEARRLSDVENVCLLLVRRSQRRRERLAAGVVGYGHLVGLDVGRASGPRTNAMTAIAARTAPMAFFFRTCFPPLGLGPGGSRPNLNCRETQEGTCPSLSSLGTQGEWEEAIVTEIAQHVLVVDDEPIVREVVTTYLERDGHEVAAVGDGASALDRIKADPPDLVVLDVMLPYVGGLDVLRELRRTSEVPVILLTANGAEADRCRGLDLGADDYVVKPFSARELASRVRSVLRRSPGSRLADRIEASGLTIEPTTRAVRCDGVAVDFVRREFDLLAFLASHRGQVFTRTQLLQQVWDSSPDWQDPATVTVHVRRIRTKLGGDPERFIETVWGVGYRFAP